MSHGLVVGDDARVAEWAFRAYNFTPTKYDLAFGIADSTGHLRGAVLFQCYNGVNVEISYYGTHTLTPGIIRALARTALSLNIARVTAVTSCRNKRLIRAMERLGFERECVMRRYYGHQDTKRAAAQRLVMFRERVERLAQRIAS